MVLLRKLGIGVVALTAVLLGIVAAIPSSAQQVEPVRKSDVAAPKAPAKEPAWKTEFRKIYGLKDGELLRRVAPPYPDCRAEYFRENIREHYRANKLEIPEAAIAGDSSDRFTKFGWKDGWPVDRLTQQTMPIKPDEGVRLVQLLHMTTGFGHTRTEGDAELLEHKVTGDFVVRADADPVKVAARLQQVLRRECELPLALVIDEVEREVYVLSGEYVTKPLADRKENQIELYGFELTDRGIGGGGSGTLQEMADHIEGFVEGRIVLGTIKNAPKRVEWHFNYRSPVTAAERAQDRDPESVLKNLAAQTGLTAKLEKRKLNILTVKKVD